MKKTFTIQQVAEVTRLSVHTLRYYEKIGLLGPIQRNQSGYREYTENDITWIEFLCRLRLTGMPLSQMKRFADLRNQGDATTSQRKELLEIHQRTVKEQIARLEQNLLAIKEKIEYYRRMEVLIRDEN